MKIELERQLAEYGRQIDKEIRPLALPYIEAYSAPTRTRRPGWVVALAAAIAVLVVVGGALLLAPGNNQAPVLNTPDHGSTTLTSAATPTSATTPTSLGAVEPDATPIAGVEGSIYFVARWANPVSGVDRTEAVWYLDADTWRWETTESRSEEADGPTELEGQILVRQGDSMFEYLPISDTFTLLDPTLECTDTGAAPENCVSDVEFDPTADGELFYPTEYVCNEPGTCVELNDGEVWEECSVGDGGLVAGLSTTRYQCAREVVVSGITETESLDLYQNTSSRTMRLDLVIFQETGQRDEIGYEILEIDLAPFFNPSLFEFECPTDTCRDSSLPPDPFQHRLIGQVAPPTSGDLLGGGSLDLADLRGGSIIFNLWASWCGPCIAQLEALQIMSEENPDITFVTGLVVDDLADALAVMDGFGITLSTIDFTEGPSEDSFLDVWGALGIPTTFFIDERGEIVAVQTVGVGAEGLSEILGQLGW